MQDNNPQSITEAEASTWRDMAPRMSLFATQRWAHTIAAHPAIVEEFGHLHPEVQPMNPEITERVAESVKGKPIIRFSPQGCMLRVVFHELAHQYAYERFPDHPDHGPQFAAINLKLHDTFMGPLVSRRLRRNYNKWNVSIGRL